MVAPVIVCSSASGVRRAYRPLTAKKAMNGPHGHVHRSIDPPISSFAMKATKKRRVRPAAIATRRSPTAPETLLVWRAGIHVRSTPESCRRCCTRENVWVGPATEVRGGWLSSMNTVARSLRCFRHRFSDGTDSVNEQLYGWAQGAVPQRYDCHRMRVDSQFNG